MKTEKISYLLGTIVSVLFCVLSFRFYEYQNLRNEEQDPKSLVGLLANLDLKILDLKMQIRGAAPADAPVALIAVDDRSLDEVGRWPWDRQVIARMVDRVFEDGAKALGFDIIFSEPQLGDGEADRALAASFSKYRDKIVTGSFSEPAGDAWAPYQDYCVNEAFIRANGGDVVKLNASFIVEDRADFYESLDFGKVFASIFEVYEREHLPLIKKNELKIADDVALTPAQARFIKIELAKKNFEYCKDWLTVRDPFLPGSQQSLMTKSYADAFKVSEKDVVATLVEFKKRVLRHPLPASWSWIANLTELQSDIDFNASFNAFQDIDGSVRRMPLFYRTGNRMGTSFVPTLSLQTYLVAKGYRAQVSIDRSIKQKKLKEIVAFDVLDPSQEPERKIFSLPVDPYGFMRVNYYGGTYSIPHVPAREILRESPTIRIIHNKWNSEAKKWQTHSEEVDRKKFFKDRALLVGATATGVYDLRVTPFEKNFPGPEIHAQALAQLFDQSFITPWKAESKWMPWVILLMGLVMSVVLTQTGAVSGILILMLTLASLVALDLYVFLKLHLIVSTMILLFLLVTVHFIVLQTYKYLTEEKKKKELKTTFAKYVSPAIVDEVLKSPENLELGGRKQRMSVFFSDVRGFTTLSERLDPQKLSDVLNRYLTPMTEIVFENKGTLDKYIGDAIMAFFGAPIAYPNHAAEACRTALQSLKKLKELQAEFIKEEIEIDIGIGINTGEMSVGNMGSKIVRNYTVMGDAVNLAARLEGITKEYKSRIIISEFTYADVKDLFTCREVGLVQVKGKKQPVRIYELIQEGKPDSKLAEHLLKFDHAYQKYLAKEFKQSLEVLESLGGVESQDPVVGIYVERCQDFIANPPPEEWDGVYIMTKK